MKKYILQVISDGYGILGAVLQGFIRRATAQFQEN
jgi:hypothetical protein